MRTEEWLTPRFVIDALGPFDLDPCSPKERPWNTARRHFTEADDGLSRPWKGRVWLNPPYGPQTSIWLRKMVGHGDGIVLTFARTESAWFAESVWGMASGVLFLGRRLRFCTPGGEVSDGTAGAPSVLIAYDQPGSARNREALRTCGLEGHFVPLDRTTTGRDGRGEQNDEQILQAAAEIRQRRVAEKIKEIQESGRSHVLSGSRRAARRSRRLSGPDPDAGGRVSQPGRSRRRPMLNSGRGTTRASRKTTTRNSPSMDDRPCAQVDAGRLGVPGDPPARPGRRAFGLRAADSAGIAGGGLA